MNLRSINSARRAQATRNTVIGVVTIGLLSLVGSSTKSASPQPPADDYLQSLRKLRNMPRPEMVFPDHPNDEDVPNSPVIAQEQWHELLDTAIQAMALLVERYDDEWDDVVEESSRSVRGTLRDPRAVQ